MTTIETDTKNTNGSRKDRFTNEKCDLLLNRFESFARQVQKQEKQEQRNRLSGSASSKSTSFSSQFSTLDSRRSRDVGAEKSCSPASTKFSSPPPIPKSTTITLYSNSTFKHDVLKNSAVDRAIDQGAPPRMVSRTSDSKLRNKVSFIETSHVTDDALAKILLDLPDNPNTAADDDPGAQKPPLPISPSTKPSSGTQSSKPPPIKPDVEENGQAGEIVITELDAENLEPKFMLIDDIDDDEDIEKCGSVSNRVIMERGQLMEYVFNNIFK